MPPRWLILADDLTGAADAGVAFAQRGCDTEVTWGDSPPLLNVTVHARDLATRACGAQEAASRHADALRAWLEPGQAVFKKMDSTLRGQPAAEIAACCETLRELGLPAWGVLAPANPPLNRTTRDGRVFVKGEPLENTETWKREHSYANADLVAMLRTAGLEAIKLPLAQVRAGSTTLAAAFRAAAESKAAVGMLVVCDAETDDDLARIAAAARDAAPGFYAGTAGLAQALAANTFALRKRDVALPATERGTLIAVGTPAKVSRDAAQKLADHLGKGAVRVDMESVVDGPAQASFVLGIQARVLRGEDTVVRLDAGADDQGALNPHFAQVFSRALLPAMQHMGGLIVTGGETAAALLERIKVRGISLLDEIEPGLALGITRGDVEVPIVTKPGAFGDEETLVRCLARMRQLRRPQ